MINHFWISGFFIGLIGGLHCIGMCGPLAMMIPMQQNSKLKYWVSTSLYHFSRIIGYALLGSITGFAGLKIKILISQQLLSIVAGIILMMILLPKLFPKLNSNKLIQGVAKPFEKWQKIIQQIILKTFSYRFGILVMGFLNAFLPCGLVYVALSNALVMGDMKNSILTMSAFGLATLPYLLFVAVGKSFIPKLNFFNKTKVSTIISLAIACLLILRGLNLNIPYISPGINYENAEVKECCSK